MNDQHLAKFNTEMCLVTAKNYCSTHHFECQNRLLAI